MKLSDNKVVSEVKEDTSVGSITTEHPEYTIRKADYTLMRDAIAGQTRVKNEGVVYLPRPSGFSAQPDGGNDMYAAYLNRAQFPEILSPMITGMVGIMHRNEAEIVGIDGTALEYIWENADAAGTSLEAFHRSISSEILASGRATVLTDAPPANVGGGNPYFSLYPAESLINWSEAGDFFVLREYVRVRNGFNWNIETRYRVIKKDAAGVIKSATFEASANADNENNYTPYMTQGNDALPDMPVVVAGSRDVSIRPDDIPLLSVARAAIAIYQLNADYRHQLFMSGQETLVFAGLEPDNLPEVVGAGVAVAMSEVGATAFYVSPSASGIAAHREAIKDEYARAENTSARVMDTTGRGAESGDALRMRARSSTATLLSVALSSAVALEKSLRTAARMLRVDPNGIIVKPNLDFIDTPLDPTQVQYLVQMWKDRVISYTTLYQNLRRGEISSPERNAEEEQKLVKKEEDYLPKDPVEPAPGVTSGPTGNNEA